MVQKAKVEITVKAARLSAKEKARLQKALGKTDKTGILTEAKIASARERRA